MGPDVEAAIEETSAIARQLLFNRHGQPKEPEAKVGLYTMQIVLPKAKAIEVLNPQTGQVFFDWQGDRHVYNAALGNVLIDAAAAGDPLLDRALCCAGAIMLDALGGIPDARLKNYVGARLTSGLALLTKRKRGQKKTDNTYRNLVIAGRLIPPLLDRFDPTRNSATKHRESACSIVSKALARMGRAGYDGVNMTEKTIEGVWSEYGPVLARS